MTGPQPTAPGGVSQSDVRKAIAIARMVLLLCALGTAGVLSSGAAALAWRKGQDTVTVPFTAALAFVVVLAAVYLFVESLRFLPPMVATLGGVVLMTAALIGGIVLAMRPGSPGIVVTPAAMVGFAVVMFALMQLTALVIARWLRRHNRGQGAKAVTGVVGTMLLIAVGLAVALVLDPDGKYLQRY